MPVRTWWGANIKNRDGYVSHSVYRLALGLALWLGCIPSSGWVDPSDEHSGCRFVNAGPKGPELEHSLIQTAAR